MAAIVETNNQEQYTEPNQQVVQPDDKSKSMDGNLSYERYTSDWTLEQAKTTVDFSKNEYRGLYHSVGLFKNSEIDYFSQRYRFGILNPYGTITSCREYLFFTKPDLNIYPRSDDSGGIPSRQLSEFLQTQPYWLELASKYFPVITCLQSSLTDYTTDPFNQLLANTVVSNLDIPTLNSEMIETPVNTYGVGLQYHGSAEASDDNVDFSLEFKDTKDLPVYHFFRAYEDYQILKHHGQVPPWIYYIMKKILYDQYSIYKFLVDEDGETIIYWAKAYGVKSKSLPRDVFSNTSFEDGISYSIDFNAAFMKDMDPMIIKEFNKISKSYYDSMPYQIDIHNHILDRVDNRPAKAAYIVEEYSNMRSKKVYKLKWRGDARE